MLNVVRRPAGLLAAALVLGAAMAGCGSPVKTVGTAQQPANFGEAARLRRVVVLRFDRVGPFDVTPEVEAQLAGARLGDTPYFTVVERARMNEALKEMKLAESGALDASTASRLGRMVAANGVYMGAVTRDDAADERYNERRSQCAQYKQERDKKGNVYDGACARFVDVQVACVKRAATFAFSPKLVDVESGTIKYAKTIVKSVSSSACGDEARQLSPLEQHKQESRALALREFREDVAPYSKRIDIVFMDSTDGLVQAAAKQRFEGALAFAKASRLDRACEMWDEIAGAEDASPALHYNRGACAEVGGDLDRALALYTRADRLLTKPDKTISAGLERARDARAARAKAASQAGR